jgi:post-segregation antitoxin (ccd killing protein)
MQVYLPDDLYAQVKDQHLPASELLQQAVRAEVRRRELLAAGDTYIAELAAQVGAPSARERARADELARRVVARSHRKAG